MVGATISPRSLYWPNDKGFIMLDDTIGLRWISTLSKSKLQMSLIYKQYGCYDMQGYKDLRLVLGCAPAGYSSFVLKMAKKANSTGKSYP